MDYDSSSKFIASLAKFLQSLCNGYVQFDSRVQVIGHLYVSVDTGATMDYVLNERVCRTTGSSDPTYISNSFQAISADSIMSMKEDYLIDKDKEEAKNILSNVNVDQMHKDKQLLMGNTG